MSRDIGKKHAKTPRGILYLLNSYIIKIRNRVYEEQNMINEEKVKIMTKLAMYEQGKGDRKSVV